MDPLSVIPARTSRRSYTSQDLSLDQKEFITHLITTENQGPLGHQIPLKLVFRDMDPGKKLKLGTYGFIQGARYFIAGQIKPETTGFLDFGYVMEQIILSLSEAGLGNCWQGGTFDRSEFGKAIDLQPDWVIPAITPVGVPTQRRSLGDRIVRVGAGSKRRKDWDEIFFQEQSLRPFHPDEGGSLTQCLEMLRLAPSASNLQPWRLIIGEHILHFYLNRKAGYRSTFGAVDIQMIDMGIAMNHLDLSAKACGISGDWTFIEAPGTLFDWEYVISYHFH